MNFIKVHKATNRKQFIILNARYILKITVPDGLNLTYIDMADGSRYEVIETPEEIFEQLEEGEII